MANVCAAHASATMTGPDLTVVVGNQTSIVSIRGLIRSAMAEESVSVVFVFVNQAVKNNTPDNSARTVPPVSHSARPTKSVSSASFIKADP